MVAWLMELFTPEYPQGRQIILIANDLTHQIGSFGPLEDELFKKASEYARAQGLPRIYISANSGARIGLAMEVVDHLNIAWKDPSDSSKGHDYLYLTHESFEALVKSKSIAEDSCEEIRINGLPRYKLIYILGKTHGIGVENLTGSGMIAGETCRAYQEIFTLTMVSCRSVGIGAYLARLGQRVIQVEYSPIILTGASALNKVLGKEVYSSNLQLGGPQIMARNGISHMTVGNDMEGVLKIVQWLSYVPKTKDSLVPSLPSLDSVDRDIQVPLDSADPRSFLAGFTAQEKVFKGFFDYGSIMEVLAEWAKGVVAGRARLGGTSLRLYPLSSLLGIPMGFIAVDTRTNESVVYADPAIESSTEQRTLEAGSVWYPSSSFKTAQAVSDMNRENLPLIIFANWRGFSGTAFLV